MMFDDPENPSVMEDFLRAIGAEPAIYSYRNECCGGYMSLESERLTQDLCLSVLKSASKKGSEGLVTACPLCRYNLEKNAIDNSPKIYYFTELLAEALGVK
jgi:heterodisulfide reductase subunit B